ncbi:tektin-2 [Coccinella septempunctata]|uniref:tektin-2 n=1 Tax=Coccinella septempunctata TaxID=41139 RepID=UPI001D07702B|nr:tektin-2 [Coccinella septempunctata]XP_044766749.1 tektin-2 [Coccinella septempunctata]
MSVVTFEKPIQHIGLADWQAKQWQNQQTNDTRRDEAFNLRHESRQLRNETRIRTDWDTYHNNVRLADRVTELDRWRDLLQACLDRVNSEINALKDEKFSTEREIDALGIPLSVVSECISMRDNRLGAELTYDDADTELKKELCVVEAVKKHLMERCLAAWEKINKLQEVKFKLELDLNDKTEAREVDKDQLTLDKNCANISHKTDPLRIVKSSIPYESWLEHSRYTKLLADSELQDTYKLREALFVVRERSRNDMRAQRDTVDFTLRKRIYETQKARNELEWQQKKMREEMERVQAEIINLENSIQDKEDAMKLAETRLENRSYRPGFELARDEAENGLKDEVMQLKQTLADIFNKLNCAKATYNALEDQQLIIDKDLANKSQSLMTDVRCLDMRIRLRTGEFAGPATDTDRNIVLTRMENEIPPN